jgi:hypothetical protein
LVLNPADDVLARARAMLEGDEPSTALALLPEPLPERPAPRRRHSSDLLGDEVKFVIRLQEGLRIRVARLASRSHRSMNSEFVHGMTWWVDRQALMWAMLQATDHELARLEALRRGEEQKALDAIVQRLPQTAALVTQLKAMIDQG